jgi:peptidoglycan hydrolase CwlO-like protein
LSGRCGGALKGPRKRSDLTPVNPFSNSRRRALIGRLVAAALLVLITALPVAAPAAPGKPSLTDLEDRRNRLHGELEAALARIEKLRLRHRVVFFQIAAIEDEIHHIEEGRAELEARVVAAANRLYQTSSTDALEVLLSASSFSDLQSRAQALDRLGELDAASFEEFAVREAQLAELQDSLSKKSEELAATRGRVDHERAVLEARFELASNEYRELKRKLAAAARRAARR